MGLSLSQERAVADLAAFLYDFLPGEPHPYADATVSFVGVAKELRLSEFWSRGSKKPALTRLLTETLERRPTDFCGLVTTIVKRSMRYGRAPTLTCELVEELNHLVAAVGFKIPELHDPAFLSRLPREKRPTSDRQGENVPSPQALKELQQRLIDLSALSPQDRGYKFEKFLNALFGACGLTPQAPFRLVGEQIDGSFMVSGGDTYLLEARWQNERVGQSELLILAGKIAGKAQWSRGLFVSISGFSQEGLEAFTRGKPTNLICMDGFDLHVLLQHGLDLTEVIRRKARRAAETNDAFVPVRELFLLG